MADYQWNPLIDEKKFEDLVNDLCSVKYGLEFQIYGRKGQKQYGIDGFALTNENKHILNQCKNKMISRRDSDIQSELLNDLETETNSMIAEFIEKRGYVLDKFIFANSFKRDTKLQDKAIELSQSNGITVVIWSWDEISDMLEEYMDIAKKYYLENFQDDGSIKTIYAKNNVENLINYGKIIFGTDNELLTIKTNLKRKYKEVKEFKKAIFTYYSIYGTNFDSFTRATTFDELFNILEKEEVCFYCLSKGLGKEYEFLTQSINCDELKVKIESTNKEEISGLILRINWNKTDETCTIDGYLRFTSESFESLKNVYEKVIFNYQTIKDILKENLGSRRHARSIELQLILPNELYDTRMNFECEDNKIKIVKRLLLRIENHNQSYEIKEILLWQRNSNFYQNHQEDNVGEDSFHNNHNNIEEFQEYHDDKHICLLSDICLNSSIKEIYDYGVPIAFYSYSKECEILNNLNFKNKKVKNIKSTIFKFMKKNQKTHFIYDDYYDVDFLKHESKVEGTEDDYLE